MSATRESSLKRSVIKRLTALFPEGCVRKRHGTSFAVKGDPDVYALIGGAHLEIELKAVGEEPTRLQSQRLRDWERAGAHVCCVHTVAELEDFLVGIGLLDPAACHRAPRRRRAGVLLPRVTAPRESF